MISTARIEVQKQFCHHCAQQITRKLSEIDAIQNIRLYPKEALVTFHFKRVHGLSTALNLLLEIGYHEKKEKISARQFVITTCEC